MRTAGLLALAFVLLASPAAAAEAPCRTVHGRLSLWNGNPTVRLWVVGTHRVLGVAQPNGTLEDLPPEILRLWAAGGNDAMWASELYGDFRVCPLAPERPGRMQGVRLESGRNLVLKPGRR
jgi:hypothetical protein